MTPDPAPNRLLSLLEQDGDISIANLKRRYRLLCKEAHPDLMARDGRPQDRAGKDAAERHEAFLRLNADYRAALAVLRGPAPSSAVFPGERPSAFSAAGRIKTKAETRSAMLDCLRTYAYKFYSRDSEHQLEAFIRAAAEYDPKRVRLLRAYKAEFLDSYHAWLSDGRVYYAHAVLIAALRQLFYYYDTGSKRHALLLERFLNDARLRAGKLSAERRRVVEIFSEWIDEEAKTRP
jgi:hypothetical protein